MHKIIAETNGDSSNEGWMATWNTGPVDRDHVVGAFKAVGAEHFIPAASAIMTLKDSAGMVVDSLNLKVRGSPIEIRDLDRTSIACEAVRIVRGAKRNTYPHLFSCALVDNGGSKQVEIVEYDTHAVPDLANNKAGVELMLNAAFWHHHSLIQPTHLTTALGKLLRSYKAVRIKEGVYFLPGQHTEQFDSVVSTIEQHPSCKARFTTMVWKLAPGTRSFKAVIAAARDEIQMFTKRAMKELDDARSTGMKLRSDGIKSKLNECVEWREFAKFYGETVAPLGDDIDEAIAALETSIANYGLLSLGGM